MGRLTRILGHIEKWGGRMRRLSGGVRQVDTELMRCRRELARSEGQAGHNLTVQTTIDMARTQTWTGGGG